MPPGDTEGDFCKTTLHLNCFGCVRGGWAIMPSMANTGSIAIAQSGCHRCRLLRCRYLYVSREMLFLVDIPWKIPQTPEGLWKDY